MHVATNFERTVTTSAEGGYTITAAAGRRLRRHHHRQRAFRRRRFDNIELTAGSTVRVDGKLAVGGLQDAVTVTAEAKQIQTDSVKVTTAISTKFIQDLPLVVGGQLRSPLDLSLIAPEAKTGNSGDGGRGNIVIGGGQEGGWDLTVDGVSATPGAPFEQRLWTTLNSPSVEAITEFAVDTNGFKAEFGHAGGGAVSFVSRSGTNQWRGKVFEFMRDDAFDTQQLLQQGARPPQAASSRSTISAACSADPVMLPKIYNGRDKTFFFASYEAYRNKTSAAPQTVDHSDRRDVQRRLLGWRDASGNLIPIYDPATTRPNPNGPGFIRDPFPNNQIPLEPLQPDQPRDDRAGDDAPGPAGRAQQLRLHPRRPDQHQPVEQVQPQARSQPVEQGSPRLPAALGRGAGGAAERRAGRRPAGAAQQLPRRGLAHLRLSRQLGPRDHAGAAQPRDRSATTTGISCAPRINRDQGWGTQIGLRNVPSADKLFPLIDFSDEYLDWGRSEFGGSGNYLWDVSDDLTWVKSKHTWKFGFIVQQDHYDGYGWHTAAGTYNFNRGATAGFLANGNLDATGATGNAFASFLLGEVQSSEITTNRYVSDRWRYYSGYAQDDWRISDKLTLNYGVRYEYTPPTWEGYFPDGYSNFNPNLPNPAAGGHLGASEFAGEGPGRTGKKTMYERVAVGPQPAPRRSSTA